MPRYDAPHGLVPDDWKKLPSGLYVKVWTAVELAPESRKIVVDAAHAFVDDMGWRLAIDAVRHRDCEQGKCSAREHNSTWN